MADRILIIEDDKHFTAQLRELFEFHGLRVTVCLDGAEGIETFRRFGADFVIVDVMLPKVHGLEVVEAIRGFEGGADVPIVLMSAVYRNESLFKADLQRLGILSFLPKPFSILDLGRKVQGVLTSPDAGRGQVRELLAQVPTAAPTPAPAPKAAPKPAAAPQAAAPVDPPSAPVRQPVPSQASMAAARLEERLDRQGYVRLLTHLFISHSSGILTLERDGQTLRFHLLNGYPVWAESSRASALLDWLVDEGVVDAGSVEHLRRLTTGRAIRAELLRSRLIPPDDLGPLLEGWVAWTVARGLEAESESRGFQETDEFVGKVPVYEVNPLREVWAALQAVPLPSLARDLEALQGRSLGRTRSFNRLFGYLGASPKVRALGEHLLQDRRYDDVVQKFSDSDEVFRCLWLLVAAGLVAVSDAPETNRSIPRISLDDEQRARMRKAAERLSSGRLTAVPGPGRASIETRRVGRKVVDEVKQRLARGRHDTAEARIARDYVSRLELDHYGFLDIESDATPEAIEDAYEALAPSYRLRNLGAEIHDDTRRQAKELLARLMTAYQTLMDPKARAAYDRDLLAGDVEPTRHHAPLEVNSSDEGPLEGYPSPESAAAVRGRTGALGQEFVTKWLEGRRLMDEADYGRAMGRLEALRSEHPAEPGLLADLAWCALNLGIPTDPRVQEKAQEWIGIAVAFDRAHHDVVDVRARILTFSDDHADAEKALTRLSNLRPELAWVKLERKRHADAREAASGDNPGLLGGLFGRGRGGKS